MKEDTPTEKKELTAVEKQRGVSCDAICRVHKGEVKEVHVINEETGTDWGIFNYCEFAIKQDRKDGFKVEVSS